MTETRLIRWIEQAASAALRWNQHKTLSDGADTIERPTDRTTHHLIADTITVEVPVIEQVSVAHPETDDEPAHTTTEPRVTTRTESRSRSRFQYGAARRELVALTTPIWTILTTLYGQKWPVTWFHYDVVSQAVQYRLTKTIGTETEQVSETTTDRSVVQACVDATERLAQRLSVLHGHPIVTAPVPAPDEPAPEVGADHELDIAPESGPEVQ